MDNGGSNPSDLFYYFLDMYRSFAARDCGALRLRMTTMRDAVILSGAKDLYEMCMNNILNPSSRPG